MSALIPTLPRINNPRLKIKRTRSPDARYIVLITVGAIANPRYRVKLKTDEALPCDESVDSSVRVWAAVSTIRWTLPKRVNVVR